MAIPEDHPHLMAPSMRLAQVSRIDAKGTVWVTDDDRVSAARPLLHVTQVMLRQALRQHLPVVVMRSDGAKDGLIILGVVGAEAATTVAVDGKAVEITGQQEIVLRCGKSSITLTRAGQIVLRGEFIKSVAHGPQQIQGATVAIN
jgi:hypothetical protein